MSWHRRSSKNKPSSYKERNEEQAQVSKKQKKLKDPPSAINSALRLLSRREHSKHELRKKLLEREFEVEQVDTALAKMLEHDLQSDERFVKASINMRANSGHGPRRIKAELGQHQLEEGQLETAMADSEVDWTANARQIVIRRFGKGELDFKTRNKAMNFLLRRGFSFDDAKLAVSPSEDEEME